MKKKTLLCFTCAGAVLLGAGITLLLHQDALVSTETKTIDNTTCILHVTEKESTEEFSVSKSVSPLSDDVYEIQIIINGDSAQYVMHNIRLTMELNADTEVRSAYFSGGEGIYAAPLIDYSEGNAKVQCTFHEDYGHLQMIVKGDNPSDAPLHLRYDMNGTGLYGFNAFTDLELTIPES